MRFAAAGARLGETYVKVGLVPGAGGAYFCRAWSARQGAGAVLGAELLKADERCGWA